MSFSTFMSIARDQQAAKAAYLSQPLWLPAMEAPALIAAILRPGCRYRHAKITSLAAEFGAGRGCILNPKQEIALIEACHNAGREDFLKRFYPVPYENYRNTLKH